jgi:hypothetical protein
MTRTAFRRLGLLVVAATLLMTFVWSEVRGQFRPPIPRPPIVGPQRYQYSCSGCGKVIGQGISPIGPPICPFCHARLTWTGAGIHPPAGGNPANPPAGFNNPPAGFNNPPAGAGGGNNTLPTQPPPAAAPPIQPTNGPVDNTPPPAKPVADSPRPEAQAPVSPTTTDSTPSTSSSSSGPAAWTIILAVGLGVVGLTVLAGGIWMLTASGTSKNRPRRRRPRRDDYDD